MSKKDLNIIKNHPFGKLTTLGVGGPAKYFKVAKEVEGEKGLAAAIEWAKSKKMPFLVMGGGCNMVVADRGYHGLVIRMEFDELKIIKENKNFVFLEVGAGVSLNRLISFAVNNNYWGMENMAWIPGKVGGAVYQNAGAYGQEIGEVVDEVEAFVPASGKIERLKKKQCAFVYRKSIFDLKKNKYIILKAVVKLRKRGRANLAYPDLKKYFGNKPQKNLKTADIKEAVIQIRKNKLDAGSEWGSAGSFFKNLLLTKKDYQKLLKNLQNNFGATAVARAEDYAAKLRQGGKIKIPTAWLIDLCGLKGKSLGGAKVFEKQALFLLAKREAKASEVMRLFKLVRQTVYQKTRMIIEPEVKLVGFSKKELCEYFSLRK